MSAGPAPNLVYRSIQPYQTRVIRLHGDQGSPGSLLKCDLLLADILHPKYEGFGVRSLSGEEDHLEEYDALSYSWGNSDDTEVILCNNVKLLVSKTLFEALKTLRQPLEQVRYLWVDAICINQSDDKEKSEQVWNMLSIYRNATRVIAWLGAASSDIESDIENVLVAASSISVSLAPENMFDFWSISTGLTYLYTRPWFERIWVQQEIFAARKLDFQCGDLRFDWMNLLSKPRLLLRLPHLQPYRKSLTDGNQGKKFFMKVPDRINVHIETISKLLPGKKENKKSIGIVPDEINAQLETISKLEQLYNFRLNCFEQFSKENRQPPDFIDTLLHTGLLKATNPLDYIYGIVGITGFPAKAMTIQEWTIARQHEVFIPIDYSANLTEILSAVTWAALMMGGLAVIAKFKAFIANNDDTDEHLLPSWVIDWRLAAGLFVRGSIEEPNFHAIDLALKLENAWANQVVNISSYFPPTRTVTPRPPPAAQVQFCKDNMGSTVPYTKLILRGIEDPTYRAEGKCIWDTKQRFNSKPVWKLEYDVCQTDLIVFMLSFTSMGCKGLRRQANSSGTAGPAPHRTGGLWVLRPVGDDQFKLIACLSFLPVDLLQLYDNWVWSPGYSREASLQALPVHHCHRFAREPELGRLEYVPPFDVTELTAARNFTII